VGSSNLTPGRVLVPLDRLWTSPLRPQDLNETSLSPILLQDYLPPTLASAGSLLSAHPLQQRWSDVFPFYPLPPAFFFFFFFFCITMPFLLPHEHPNKPLAVSSGRPLVPLFLLRGKTAVLLLNSPGVPPLVFSTS